MNRPPIINESITTPSLVITGSFLFCAKGIIVKALFEEGLSPNAVMALRMLSALPFFLIMVALRWHQLSQITRRDWAQMGVLAFVGFFLCSLINFTGLQYVSVGLERIILFSYPSIVLAGSFLFQGKRPTLPMLSACFLSWIGLTIMVRDEIHLTGNSTWILYGTLLILLSAGIYAGYILLAKPIIQRVGTQLYTGISMSLSACFVLLYFSLTGGEYNQLVKSQQVLSYGLVIGILGTVAPTFLLSYGLSKISADAYAVISSIGPVATIALATGLAGQMPTLAQCLGIGLSIVGAILAAKPKSPIALSPLKRPTTT
ncbi:DMT family transporter [Rubritalea tangerina]|uniref:DMT family transporter n=1 Tax=Rubritalea tangerina TaxID=430798 RepID=A0ABW4ZEB9_9BACT